MIVHNLEINESDNPEYYQLLRDAQELQKRWHLLNNELHDIYLNRGKIKLGLAKNRLRGLYPDTKVYIQDCLEWKKRAHGFLVKPILTVRSSAENQIPGFNLGLDHIRDTIEQISGCIDKIDQNYNGLRAVIENQSNFNLAILSLIISLIGLFVSLFK